ncbi:hypothetical protein IV417_17775 [Alphaproteobacteria bacterium KMM 3653]|uniref:ATP-grasp domain-containing protein n=1 Tax=Harenicola maris TaxID=2841044 RepID=A0AAP2CVE4_9RHOB|nr:hypothetical protein [Harenicola maris]
MKIIYVTVRHHRYTMRSYIEPLAEQGVDLTIWSYDNLLDAVRLPKAVYILSDFDRLHPWLWEVLGRYVDLIRAGGGKVLNDPRLFRPRHALIRTLKAEGINDYTCALPALGEWPERYPVFLRTLTAHRGVGSDLLEDRAAAEAALDTALKAGHAIADLLFIEFAAEPIEGARGPVYHKLSNYKIGEAVVPTNGVFQDVWEAKYGTVGAGSDESYARERAEMADDPNGPLVARVFEIARVDFGRVDYGFYKGRPQIYEINTNPMMHAVSRKAHPNADREEAIRIMRENVMTAFLALPVGVEAGVIDVGEIAGKPDLPVRTLRQP